MEQCKSPRYTQIIPDYRYDECERRRKGKKMRKGREELNPAPLQVCLPLPSITGKTTTRKEEEKTNKNEITQRDKNEKSEKTETPCTNEKTNEKEAAGDSAVAKLNRFLLCLLASCFPAGAPESGKPVKMMLCLPCPPPEGIASSNSNSNSGSQSDKPKDYTYRCESRELRGGNLYSCCQCLKRNGLQHDCPRTPCQGRPACLTKPWPDCWPSGGCHGVDYSREKGVKRYDPCREARFDKKGCGGSGGSGGPGGTPKGDGGNNMMVVVCPPS